MKSKWQITYYNTKVETKILSWPKRLLERYLRFADLLEKEGIELSMPYSKSLGRNLFEMRINAQNNCGRIFYCFAPKNEIVILHSFIKKTQQTPKQEIKIARKRLKEIKNEKQNNS